VNKLRKILFIINPISGIGKKETIPGLIHGILDELFDAEIIYTKGPKHATELSKEAAAKDYYAVFAVGGDGSVNEVAQGLINTKTRLGIIPVGSGNGLARHLKIPLNSEKAIRTLLSGNYVVLDAGQINNHFFVGTAGVAFDAKIAERFWKLKNRGLISYLKTIVNEFKRFTPPTFRIIDGNQEPYQTKAFILSVANASQYGNQAIIAPGAHAGDGYLELCSIDTFPAWKSPFVALRLLTGTLNGAKYYHRKIVTELKITGDFSWFHADGEPFECDGEVNIKIIPEGLKVLAPQFH
jgi:diacylglycerol kinase (ATP)